MGALFGGGGGGGSLPMQDSSALIAERQRQEQEAREQAIKTRTNQSRSGGMFSLFNKGTGAQGVTGTQTNQTLGGTA